MSFISDIANRWSMFSATPYYVGAVSEGVLPPYVVFVIKETRPRISAPNTVNYRKSVITFSAVANNSVDATDLADISDLLYNMKSFQGICSMIETTRSTYYTENPTLTGNRAWVSSLTYTVMH